MNYIHSIAPLLKKIVLKVLILGMFYADSKFT